MLPGPMEWAGQRDLDAQRLPRGTKDPSLARFEVAIFVVRVRFHPFFTPKWVAYHSPGSRALRAHPGIRFIGNREPQRGSIKDRNQTFAIDNILNSSVSETMKHRWGFVVVHSRTQGALAKLATLGCVISPLQGECATSKLARRANDNSRHSLDFQREWRSGDRWNRLL